MKTDREMLRTLAVFVAGFLNFFNLYVPQAFLQLLAKSLNTTPTLIGLSVTVTLLAVSTVAPIAGAISDRLGRKRIIVPATFALTCTTLLVAQSSSLTELLVWRTVQGALLPFIFTVTVAYVADECSGPQAVKTSGIYSSGTILGGFSGRLFGGVMADYYGWHMAFLAIAAITLLCALFVMWALPRERNFRPLTGGIGGTLRAYREHLRNPRLLATCGIGYGMLFSMVASFTFVNFRLAEPPFSLSPTKVGSIFAVYLLAMVSAPLSTRVAVRIGRIPALMLSIGCAIFGLLLTLSNSLPMVIAGLAFSTAGFLMIQALSLGFIGAIVPHARSSAVGLYVTIYYIGGALGSFLPGPIWHNFGWIGVIVLLCVNLSVMAAVAQKFWRLPKPAPSWPSPS